MRRGRKLFGGLAVLVAALVMGVPAALADASSAVDQGYPCATTPPGAPGGTSGTPGGTSGTEQCGTTTPPAIVTTPAPPPVVSTPAPVQTPAPVVHTPAPATQPATENVAGANHTVKRTAAPATAANVAPARASTLPFTGAQLGVFVVLGLLLIAGGLVLRASGKSRPTA